MSETIFIKQSIELDIPENTKVLVVSEVIEWIIDRLQPNVLKKTAKEMGLKVKGFTKITDSTPIPPPLLKQTLLQSMEKLTRGKGREAQVRLLRHINEVLCNMEQDSAKLWASGPVDRVLENPYLTPLIKLIYLAVCDPERVNGQFAGWRSGLEEGQDVWVSDELAAFDFFQRMELWNEKWRGFRPADQIKKVIAQTAEWDTSAWNEYFEQFRTRLHQTEDWHMAWSQMEALRQLSEHEEPDWPAIHHKWNVLAEWLLLMGYSSENRIRALLDKNEEIKRERASLQKELEEATEEQQDVPAAGMETLLNDHETPVLWSTEAHPEFDAWFGEDVVNVHADPGKLKSKTQLKQIPLHKTIYLYAPNYPAQQSLELERFMREAGRRMLIHQGEKRSWARAVIADLEGGVRE